MAMKLTACVVFVVLVAAGCGDVADTGGGDASAEAACRHFRNVAADAVQGILGEDQVLPKLREVHEMASVSDNDAVRSGATRVLAAATQGTSLSSAAADLSDACEGI